MRRKEASESERSRADIKKKQVALYLVKAFIYNLVKPEQNFTLARKGVHFIQTALRTYLPASAPETPNRHASVNTKTSAVPKDSGVLIIEDRAVGVSRWYHLKVFTKQVTRIPSRSTGNFRKIEKICGVNL
jgi:hypothetical protein